MAKTWEMIRDIKPGEFWEITDENFKGAEVSYENYGTFTESVILFDDGVPLYLTKQTLSYEWRKVPKLVDFSEAFAAFESGKMIRSAVSGASRLCRSWPEATSKFTFSAHEIAGKWEIVD